eukprot:14388857-Heterocapsa_arctica.AAC.1
MFLLISRIKADAKRDAWGEGKRAHVTKGGNADPAGSATAERHGSLDRGNRGAAPLTLPSEREEPPSRP